MCPWQIIEYVAGEDSRSEDTGQDVANHTTNTVDGEDVKSIVNTNQELELGGEVAADTADDTNNNGTVSGDEAGGRGNTNEARNGTGAEADGAPLLLKTVVEEDPGKTTHAGRQVGDVASEDGLEVHAERGTTVEAEPTNPQEDGAENNVSDVVRAVRKTVVLVVASALAEHQRVGKSASARGNVDGTATSKVVAGQVVQPAVAVPCPVCDRVVDNGGPDEDEDEGGQNATTVRNGTNGKGWRDGGEHALVEHEQNVRNTTDILAHGLHETEVVEGAEERVAGARESERVAPEEPLEGDNADREHREEQKLEGRFTAGETTVEETDTGNHQKHKRCADGDPGHVASLKSCKISDQLIQSK